MDVEQGLMHTRRECKYHVIVVPSFRRDGPYRPRRRDVRRFQETYGSEGVEDN